MATVPPRRPLKRAPMLLQAKASLQRPAEADRAADRAPHSAPLSFLQEDERSSAKVEEILTEVMAPPILPLPKVKSLPQASSASSIDFQVMSMLGVAFVVGLAAVCTLYKRPSDRLTQEVENLPVLLGSDLTNWSETGLVRLEGHIVLEGPPLTAPFSEKKCVVYSASVSHPRHDAIRNPPVAFASQRTSFSLELEDAPEVKVVINGDVSLFSMQTLGATIASKGWCSFVLTHLVSSTDHFQKCLDLGSDGVSLDFRESALLVGSHVTCVGQVVKAADGRWTLCPGKRRASWGLKRKDPLAGRSRRWKRMQEDNNLCRYFEAKYYEGHFFERGDYDFLPEEWCWHHKRTKIKVWADALDFSLGRPVKVVFHYTDELAFRRIIAGGSDPSEAWASLVQSGGAQGIYTVPKPPDEWQDKEELLENNYRQMMKRDREDPEKGEDYIAKVYPLKVAYCVPILLHKDEKCVTPPEPQARKAPVRRMWEKGEGKNGGATRKDHRDLPPRQVVTVCLADGQGAIRNAFALLLETLRIRARVAGQKKGEDHLQTFLAKHRLCSVLLREGLSSEAEPIVRQLRADCEEHLGTTHPRSLSATQQLAKCFEEEDLPEAKRLLRRAVREARKALGPQQLLTLSIMEDLGAVGSCFVWPWQ
eukprot:g22143.t1